jgi:hypothetical protein
MKGLRYYGQPVEELAGNAVASVLPVTLATPHNWAVHGQFQGLGCVLSAAIPPGPLLDIAYLRRVYAWLQDFAPDASLRTVGLAGREITCVVLSEAKLKRRQATCLFTPPVVPPPVLGAPVLPPDPPVQFQPIAFPVKGRSKCVQDCVAHALAGTLSISNVCVQEVDNSFREAFEEAKAVAAENGVEQAMLGLEAHAGHHHPVLKRRQLKDELSEIEKRARFEKRPVISLIIAAHLFLGWQTKVLGRLGAALTAPRRTLLWVYSTHGNAGKSSFADHLVATFRWGVFRGSSRSNQHGMGHCYGEEGLIIFDLARNARLSRGLLELMELVTNVGATLPTEKYSGSDPTLRASVLVFANRPSPASLRHRAVYQLRVPAPIAGEVVCDGNGDAACGCAYHARLRLDVVTDFARVY